MKLRDLQQEFSRLLRESGNGTGIYLVNASRQDCDTVTEILLRALLQDGKRSGIYVTLNKGYQTIKQTLESQGINSSQIYFIDGISQHTTKKEKGGNCTFLSGPGSLTELSLAITQALDSGKFGFLFFDSLNTLLMYYDLKTIEKFNHYLISKLRGHKIISVIVSLKQEGEGNKLISTVSQFCDAFIDVE